MKERRREKGGTQYYVITSYISYIRIYAYFMFFRLGFKTCSEKKNVLTCSEKSEMKGIVQNVSCELGAQ